MSRPSRTLALDEHLCFSLYGASMAIGRAYKPLLDEWGITYPQFLVLGALWESDGLSVVALARRLALEPSTITPLVKRLALADLVTSRRNPDDGRQVIVGLTQEGRALRARTACLADTLLTASGMTLERLHRLNDDVRALRDAVAGRIGESEGSLEA